MKLEIILQIVGAALGLLYLYFEYKANIYLWIVGLIMPAVNGFLYFQKGIYADVGMNIYYILAGIYGWIIWNNHKPESGKAYSISKTPLKKWLHLAFLFVIIDIFITYILIKFTNSKVPYVDAFTTSLSIIAMWMLSRKYVEQWLVWLVVDAVTCCLYFYKNIPISASLYLLYSCLAIAGYLRWLRMMKDEAASQKISFHK
ncbi:MAG: nicotinamide riboside transporter PnuC [Prevotellaceae bacterium]|jgi:nicotinamide mononucleotide transporter|nr:nicotinamide riboside transporter PnuC [Prevotellaceae bacterium]